MLGQADELTDSQFEIKLCTDPEVATQAANVEPDDFLRKLQRQLLPATNARSHRQAAPTDKANSANKISSGEKMNRVPREPLYGKQPAATGDADLPPGTELESNEEIERARAEIRRQEASAAASKRGQGVREEQPYRPTVRPPMAILIMCDDGENSGEVFRLRGDRFIIGRTEGDLLIPDDEQVSSRHVALTRQVVSGETRWVVTDLQSRNGLFVRVGKAPLGHQSEVLIGSGRYRLDIMQQAVPETAAFLPEYGNSTTRAFESNLPLGSEILTELSSRGTGARYILQQDHYWFGSDPDCEICRSEDPFVSGKHARFTAQSSRHLDRAKQ